MNINVTLCASSNPSGREPNLLPQYRFGRTETQSSDPLAMTGARFENPGLAHSQIEQLLARQVHARKKVQRCEDVWRRGRDSNPRYSFPYSSFQDWRLKPLGHLSPTTVLLQSLIFRSLFSRIALWFQTITSSQAWGTWVFKTGAINHSATSPAVAVHKTRFRRLVSLQH
jgi:hypothetical protein